MIIIFKQINSSAKILVSGRLDVLGSAEFRRKINDLPSITKKIIFDFRDVEYVSSAGLREILICCKKFPDAKIENMRREVYDTFLMTGFDKFIPITFAGDTVARKFSVDEGLSFEKFLRDKTVQNGDKVAIVDGGKSYTWQEINRCSSVIADDLSELGVKIGSHVAICSANSINWLLTFFAIQKLGAIAVLVNFNLCAKEISALIDYADVTHFCYGEMTAAIEDVNNPCKFYSIRNEIDFRARNTVKNKFNVAISSDNPSVMIFTSGTTGRLKGVILSAYNILNAAQISS